MQIQQKGDDLMNSLEQQSIQTSEMPRFDDGMINIQELIRIMAESVVMRNHGCPSRGCVR